MVVCILIWTVCRELSALRAASSLGSDHCQNYQISYSIIKMTTLFGACYSLTSNYWTVWVVVVVSAWGWLEPSCTSQTQGQTHTNPNTHKTQERQPKRHSAATLVPALYYCRDDELRSTAAVNLFLAILMLEPSCKRVKEQFQVGIIGWIFKLKRSAIFKVCS